MSFANELVSTVQKKRSSGYSFGGIPVYNLTLADAVALENVAKKYSLPPQWLANLINHESAGTFNPAVRNPTSGATGLIQFMPSTASGLGTSTTALSKLSFQGQLPWVEKYLFNTLRNKAYICTDTSNLQTCKIRPDMREIDLYMAIFYPASMFNANYQFPANVTAANGGIRTPMDYYNKVMQHAIFKSTPVHPPAESIKNKWIVPVVMGSIILATGVALIIVFARSKKKKP